MEAEIKNRGYISQIKSFKGLQWGAIYPTDIDAFLDFGDKLFVIVEVKYGGGMPKTGQRIALERLCDACATSHRKSVLLIAKHNNEEDIAIKDTKVEHYKMDGKWRQPQKIITVKEAIETLRQKFLENE